MTLPDALPPDLDELLRAARPLDSAPEAARARLERRVALSVAAPVVAIAAATALHAAGEAANAGAGAAATRAVRGTLSLVTQKVLLGVTTFALGVGVGAATHAGLGRSEAPSVASAPTSAFVAAPPAPKPTVLPPATPDIPTVAATDLPRMPPPPELARAAAPSASPAATLAEERRLLDGARTALAHGEPNDALAPLQEHERRFAHGVLSEERDALAIQALARLGRVSDAEARAARFERAFPNSMMMPAVKDALEAARDK